MPKHMAQPIPEVVSKLGNFLVGRSAVRARVAAVLDERDLRMGGPEDMVVSLVHWAVE